MKTIFTLVIALIFCAQVIASIYLAFHESWVSGFMFFVISSIFLGFMANFADLTHRIWRTLFDK